MIKYKYNNIPAGMSCTAGQPWVRNPATPDGNAGRNCTSFQVPAARREQHQVRGGLLSTL